MEPVLPQALKDDYWKTRFTQDEHGVWLHRLGNLTLLCGHKNYKAQYYDFDRKQKILPQLGFNYALPNHTHWQALCPPCKRKSIASAQLRIKEETRHG